MNFKDILETLPSIDHLTGLDVLNGETVIHHIPAAPGKLGSLRLYNALAEKFNGKLDRTSAQQGIEWFAEHVEDAKQNPGNTRILIYCLKWYQRMWFIRLCH